MPKSKPDEIDKNSRATCDVAMHFCAKDETIMEVYTDVKTPTVDELKTMENQENDFNFESDVKIDKMTSNSEASGSHSPSPSEYRKMFKNFNEFTEKITKTVEEKISGIRSDLNSSKNRIMSSKDNSSISDSEDNSESSRNFDLKSLGDDSPRKSLSLDISGNSSVLGKVESDFEFPGVGSEVRQRKKTWPPEHTKLSQGPGTHPVNLDESFEIESAVEAQETCNVEESDDESRYLDARDYTEVRGGSPGDGPPREGNKFLRFARNPENKKIEGYAVFITLCIVLLPLPSFVRGFLTCLLLVLVWYLVTEFIRTSVEPHPGLPNTPFQIPDYSLLTPLTVPHLLVEEGVWFNEYTQPYDPELYSVSQTVPVYLEIENSYLKLSRPKGKISKRATCDEREYKLDFINQRVYDLRYCRISLRPEGILRRRYFSKKYPIYIELGPGSFVKAVKFNESNEDMEEEIDVESTYKTNDPAGGKSLYGREYLNLFARCNRQKEEWFRRLKAASRIQKLKTKEEEEEDNEASTPFENVSFDVEDASYEEYWQYMSKFVEKTDEPLLKSFLLERKKSARSKFRKRKDYPGFANIPVHVRKKLLRFIKNSTPLQGHGSSVAGGSEMENVEKSALEIQWLNAFINRFLYDVFRTPYWINKIQAKVQRKLASIRLPYYIEALEVIEMNLGKVGPRFHRISAPLLDERGLWVDMDLTFDGSFKMILQTQLNLLKLQKGLEEEVEKLPDDKNETRKSPLEIHMNLSILIKSGMGPRKPVSVKRKETKSSLGGPVRERMPSKKQLLMEFAELVVADNSVTLREQSSVNADLDNSDSTESDEDDDDYDEDEKGDLLDPPTHQQESSGEKRPIARRSSKRIFRVMESVAQSKYFKSIAETKYVQKAIAGVSATKLRLILEIKSCIGTLSVNVPPPPNDRIWYGFRNVPKLWMSAQPKVGQRNIRFSHIKHFVERKIMEEVKKIVVMPNMDDLLIPVPPDDLVSRIISVAGSEMKNT